LSNSSRSTKSPALSSIALLKGLSNSHPRAGTVWRGNIFRMDFDQIPEAKWALDPGSGAQFHNYKQFAILRFGKQETL